jgi:hypothetical protein
MILTCAISPDIAGGVFHFEKDNAQYSLKPEDYATKPRRGLPRPLRRPRRRWGVDACAPPPVPPPAALGLRKTLRLCSQTTRVVLRSSRRSGATAIRRRHLDCGDVAIRRPGGPGVGHTPSKTSRLQSAAFRSFPLPSSTPRLCQAPLACAIGYAHIEIICLQNCVNVGIDCDIIGEIIGEIMDVIIYDIIEL